MNRAGTLGISLFLAATALLPLSASAQSYYGGSQGYSGSSYMQGNPCSAMSAGYGQCLGGYIGGSMGNNGLPNISSNITTGGGSYSIGNINGSTRVNGGNIGGYGGYGGYPQSNMPTNYYQQQYQPYGYQQMPYGGTQVPPYSGYSGGYGGYGGYGGGASDLGGSNYYPVYVSPTQSYNYYAHDCQYPGYGYYSCAQDPNQWIYDPWTGTWY